MLSLNVVSCSSRVVFFVVRFWNRLDYTNLMIQEPQRPHMLILPLSGRALLTDT